MANAKADKVLALVRKICLGLPDIEEKVAWGEPTWRVHGKLFAMFSNNHHGDGRIAVWCNAPPGAQQDLVAADPKHFFVPPYVGVGGWIGINLNTKLPNGARRDPRTGVSHNRGEARSSEAATPLAAHRSRPVFSDEPS